MAPPSSALEFEVSAPGKVILHGEHSVIYGYPAVAGPIGLRTYLRFSHITSQPEPSAMVVLEFLSLPSTISVTLASFNTFLAAVDCHGALQPLECLEQIRTDGIPFTRTLPSIAEGTTQERFALGATLYIINRVLRAEGIQSIDPSAVGPGGFKLSFSSEMSIGAGLGSSASFGVCLAAGAYALARVLQGQPVTMDHGKVSGWAFDS
uniref:GHMP kinase N-terminal domain-containing protein n=1 Tax=Anopheles atroparvus TaxID=41427 RepID=A0AAG5DL68_ANOAO